MALDRPIGPRSVHLCIDMQRLLGPEGPWPTPWAAAAMPCILQLLEHRPGDAIFTRFIPPANADQMPGTWRRFYRKWRNVTRDNIDPGMLELIDPLGKFVPPAWVVDKTRYSAFAESKLPAILADRGADTLIFSGAETDVCVLATLMGAVDRGYRVIVSSDAVCSSSDTCHDALITLYRQRFSEQVEIADTAEIIRAWSLAA